MVSPKLQQWLDEHMPEGASDSSAWVWPGYHRVVGWHLEEIGFVPATPDETIVAVPVPDWLRAGRCPVCLDRGEGSPEMTICFASEAAALIVTFLAQLEEAQRAASA